MTGTPQTDDYVTFSIKSCILSNNDKVSRKVSCSYLSLALFPTRHYSWRVLLRLHCYADPRRVAGSAVWRDPCIRDLSRDRLDSYHADTNSSTNERRSSDYSQGGRGAGFGKSTNNGTFP